MKESIDYYINLLETTNNFVEDETQKGVFYLPRGNDYPIRIMKFNDGTYTVEEVPNIGY